MNHDVFLGGENKIWIGGMVFLIEGTRGVMVCISDSLSQLLWFLVP